METINPKHIRIGNWITGIDGKPIQVTANTIVILEMAPKWTNGETGYKPIPITQQWLKDAGFEKGTIWGAGNTCYSKNDIDIYQTDPHGHWKMLINIGRGEIIKECPSIHFLQNFFLYFCGEELIFNR